MKTMPAGRSRSAALKWGYTLACVMSAWTCASYAADGTPAVPVTAALAQAAVRPAMQEASGVIAPWEEVSISARVAGLPLLRVNVRVGDRVRKGQVLAQFDEAAVGAELAQAEANLQQVQASAEEAAANKERAVMLKSSGAMSAQDILQLTTRAAVAQGQVAQAKAALTAARVRLDYSRVTAPDAGVISSRTALLGSVPQLGSELFRLIAQDRLEWRAELTGPQLAKVKSGLPATITLPDERVVGGRVREVSPALDPNSRLGIAYVDLERSEAARANMYVKGSIELERRSVVLVPTESIVTRDGRAYAVTLSGERAKLMPVTLGLRRPELTEVLSGVEAGQRVIVRGAGFLSDGARVRVSVQ